MDDISANLRSVQDAIAEHEPGNKSSQSRMVDAIQRLQIAAEGPSAYVSTFRFQFAQAPFLLIGVNTGILDAVVARDGKPVSAETIAVETNQDPLLVVRTMRILTAMKIAEEAAARTYASNAVTENIVTKEQKLGIRWCAELLWPISGNFSAYMSQSKIHQFPQASASEKGPFTFNFGSSMFEFLETHKDAKDLFDEYFKFRQYGTIEPWYDIYPMKSYIAKGPYEDDNVFLVDVGGNQGHDVVSLVKAYPQAREAGRLVVQDLPVTIQDKTTSVEGVEFMVYDFFAPQPLQGASYYFMHHIIHDWSNEHAKTILDNVAQAMNSDSRLLLHDFVLPDQDSPLRASLFDATMMLLLSGMERTHDQWESLLGGSGLCIEKVWYPRSNSEAVIEARLKA